MYPKKNILKLIETKAPKLIKQLGLSKWTIKFHVYKSGAKLLLDLGIHRDFCTGKCAVSFIGKKAVDIIIYYDQAANKKDAYGTLVHELLHIALHDLTGLITIKQDKAANVEERLVLLLENMLQEDL